MSALIYGKADYLILDQLLSEVQQVFPSMVEALYHTADPEAILLPDEMSPDLLRIFALRNKYMGEHIAFRLGYLQVDPELLGTKALRAERKFVIVDDFFVRQLNLEFPGSEVCEKAKLYIGKIVVYGLSLLMNDMMMQDSQGLSVTVIGPSDGFLNTIPSAIYQGTSALAA